ncbi:5-methyltetrahydropteroyltriglutamate--homocysteine methyltransferase, partial [Anaerostipes hadrus]|nr:5-methyltetrahydropteroyltriglutamate--homocysteine methyltransferase [Anaerostipes hadrus]
DFMEHLNGVKGYVPNHGYRFVGIETEVYDVRVTGKVSFNPDHPHIKDFIALKEIAGDRAVAKMTIPSPNQFFNAGI